MAVHILQHTPVFAQRGNADGVNINSDGDAIPFVLGELPRVQLFLTAAPEAWQQHIAPLDKCFGKATVASDRIYWLRDGVEVDGISIDYRAIVLHAISRSSPVEGKSSIYMQIAATKLKLSDGTEFGGEIDEEDVLEISLVPEANDTVDALFQSMSEGAAMHPDSDDEAGPDEVGAFSSSGQAVFDRLSSQIESAADTISTQFQDANPPKRHKTDDDASEQGR